MKDDYYHVSEDEFSAFHFEDRKTELVNGLNVMIVPDKVKFPCLDCAFKGITCPNRECIIGHFHYEKI